MIHKSKREKLAEKGSSGTNKTQKLNEFRFRPVSEERVAQTLGILYIPCTLNELQNRHKLP